MTTPFIRTAVWIAAMLATILAARDLYRLHGCDARVRLGRWTLAGAVMALRSEHRGGRLEAHAAHAELSLASKPWLTWLIRWEDVGSDFAPRPDGSVLVPAVAALFRANVRLTCEAVVPVDGEGRTDAALHLDLAF